MHRHHTVVQLPVVSNVNHTIPLLDDEFDPDEEEILDHDENYLLCLRQPEKEFSDDF